jgi:multimeric flavodoxin WrbA
MKAVAICGSPRKEGNTETLLAHCLKQIESEGITTEIVRLSGKTIKGCTGCGACRKMQDMTCVIKDDDFHEVFNKMLEADILITGSPVYFGSATPEIMALLDRAGYIARGNGNPFSRRIGGPITVARRAGHNFTNLQLLQWFMINDMVVPGSSYWNIAFGGKAGEAANDEEGMKTISRFGENLAWLAKSLIKEE